MTHAPFLAEAFDDPQLRCDVCGSVAFHGPDLAMQWADPYCAHLTVTCTECGADNHLRLSYRLGRVHLTQRSTNVR